MVRILALRVMSFHSKCFSIPSMLVYNSLAK
jgi:hypothetical protein